jgi:hypothetical protein
MRQKPIQVLNKYPPFLISWRFASLIRAVLALSGACSETVMRIRKYCRAVLLAVKVS